MPKFIAAKEFKSSIHKQKKMMFLDQEHEFEIDTYARTIKDKREVEAINGSIIFEE